jgi:hypothetical protein
LRSQTKTYPSRPRAARVLGAFAATFALSFVVALVAMLLIGCGTEVARRPGASGPDRGLTLVDRGIALVDGGAPQGDLPQSAGDSGVSPKVDMPQTPTPDVGAPSPDSWQPPTPDVGTPKPDQGSPAGDYDYTQHISWTTIAGTGAACNPSQYGTYYCDVMTHTKSPYLGADTLTNVHETQHFMAHEHDSATAAADKFIYYKSGKGARWPEPQLKTQGIVSVIQHQGTTYNTYIAGRPSQALGENIVDEWRAYLTEEIAAIQIAKIKGQGPGSITGLVLGGIEFMYYNAAALTALQSKEPSFLPQNKQAVAVFAMLAEEMKAWTIDQGITPGMFFSLTNNKAKQLLTDLRTAPKNLPIRNTLRSLYGPVWCKRVLDLPASN